jgi:hypothetical protein
MNIKFIKPNLKGNLWVFWESLTRFARLRSNPLRAGDNPASPEGLNPTELVLNPLRKNQAKSKADGGKPAIIYYSPLRCRFALATGWHPMPLARKSPPQNTHDYG